MKKIHDVESELENFQNFLCLYTDGVDKMLKTSIEKQNEPITKKIEEKKRL